ncbi:MAG: hypothetical protein AMJ55_05310 [Gammaproteobacteria bacterium SG8_15]|nr:MAG: hypothetical protein AMJ55_05310 [Gammaproteobacteria bacterium SG8_15]
MDPDENTPNPSSLERDWVKDALKLQQIPQWGTWLAIGLTIASCILYATLFSLISEYQLQVAERIRELPIFTRIVLNIHQPFLVVFIIISLSLWILLRLRTKRPRGSYKPFFALIIFNCTFASVLLAVSFLKIN